MKRGPHINTAVIWARLKIVLTSMQWYAAQEAVQGEHPGTSRVVWHPEGRSKPYKQEQPYSISLAVRDVKGAKTVPTHCPVEYL